MSKSRCAKGAALLAALALTLLVAATPAGAQVTTGSISGIVRSDDGNGLPGVAIVAVHVPTNTEYSATTNSEGRFRLVNVRVGGPYSLRAELDQFEPQEFSDVSVRLGEATNVEFKLGLEAVSEEIVVSSSAAEFINPNRTGSSSDLEFEQIQAFPTVRRNILLDGARTNPYASIRASDENQKDISFAGRSSKYNNIQIDGSNYNDLFGLGESGGTPAGQANSQPIQQDVVAELQVSVSPYDVRQGGFTGGVINAITRSGTNDWHGSAYYAERDPDYVGDGPFDTPIRDFDEEQVGASLGGPILRDRIWFFAAAESNEKLEASGFSADGSTGQQYGEPADAARFQDILQSKYGYEAGGLGDVPIAAESEHLFARIDWNVAQSHQLTARYSWVDASRDDVANRSTSVFRFPKSTFSRVAEIKSTVVQLNSVFGNTIFNEARLGLQTLDDARNFPEAFPSIEVGGTGPRRGDLIGGTEQFSGVNAIEQEVLEIHDDVTFLAGDHTVTIGTHHEFFDIKNFFLASAFGYYYFPTLDDLDAGLAQQYQISFISAGDPDRPVSDFGLSQSGLYAGDQWRVREDLTLSYGLRADLAAFDKEPAFNPDVLAVYGYDTTEMPDDNLILSPRVGFNWDVEGDGESQLRGGVGLFAGRTPYVFISAVYAGSGIGSSALSTGSNSSPVAIPFNPDPFGQPHSGAGSAPTVDLIDPDFEFPQVWRATLAYDRNLPWWDLRGTAEVIYSLTEEDIYYTNINKAETGVNALDGRPRYSTVSSSFRDATLLTNTGKGEDLLFSLQLSRPARGGVGFTAGYTYMDSKNAFDGTSSRAISNFQFHPTRGDIFEPELSTSSWENEHRWYVNAYYDLETGPLTHSFGLFWNAESGRPFSILMGGDPNGDGQSANDLLYVPASPDEVILSGFTWDQFVSYLSTNGVDCRGCIVKRNAQQGPWVRRLDFHYGLELPIKVVRAQVTMDLINVLNIFDEDEGNVRYVNFGTTTPIRASIDPATGKTVYSQNFSNAITETDSPFSTSDTLSRWQARLGLRLSF
jgi:outer membrane receptor for ferrienterochelin and colicin